MASGETKNQALYEQLAAACAENERTGVEHCAGKKSGPLAPGLRIFKLTLGCSTLSSTTVTL